MPDTSILDGNFEEINADDMNKNICGPRVSVYGSCGDWANRDVVLNIDVETEAAANEL